MRINEKDLKAVIERLNIITNKPVSEYTKWDGKYQANIGNYHLDCAYGGYALQQFTNVNGGVRDIFGGHFTKRELYDRIHAYLSGIELREV